VNVKEPQESKLLSFINRSGDAPTELIQGVRNRERVAITEWLELAISNPELLAHQPTSDVGIELDEALIRHLRSDHVLARFVDSVWMVAGQCINCHSPERNEKQVEEYGTQMSWITPHNPAATLEYLLTAELIDLENPDASPIRTKPTAIVDHGGGPKFPVGSAIDKKFLAFLRDYAKAKQGGYRSNKDLPASPNEITRLTEHHLRLTNLPVEWSGKLLRVDLFPMTDSGWSEQRIATADSTVSPKQLLWQNPLWSVAVTERKGVDSLPAGKYLVRIYIDRSDRMKENADARFAASDLAATAEFSGDWTVGWREPNILHSEAMRLIDIAEPFPNENEN
jgi:hypothetical protein